jgi:hypothetical protein
MTGEEIEAIVNGYHGDAFGILGPHSVRKKSGQPRWEIRAFLPQADAAAVVTGGTRYEMVKKHAQGFFVAALDGEPVPYTLRAHLWDGQEVAIDDPYHFGPQITESDLYLHTEGTLNEAWLTLGSVGAKRGDRLAGRRVQRLGHAAPPHAAAQWRRLGDIRARYRHRHFVQIQRAVALRGISATEGRPVRVPL